MTEAEACADMYTLDEDNRPVPCRTVHQWAAFKATRACVGRTELDNEVRVSTVFLGMYHRFFGEGPPILWETMIFGGEQDG